MTNWTEDRPPPRDRTFTAAFALMITALGCAVLLLAVPRPVPLSLPVLSLPRAEVDAQLAKDRALAARAPSSPAAKELYALWLELGRQELAQHAVPRALQEQLPSALARLTQQLQPRDIAALRARATERYMQALLGELPDTEEARGLLGEQPALLIAYGYLSPSGQLLAPELSVRATYKVRWNMLFGLPATAELSRIELCAYEGFRGLEARGMPPELRVQALQELARAGGSQAREALAILNADNGAPAKLLALVRSPEHGSRLRLRNMALTFVRPAQRSDY